MQQTQDVVLQANVGYQDAPHTLRRGSRITVDLRTIPSIAVLRGNGAYQVQVVIARQFVQLVLGRFRAVGRNQAHHHAVVAQSPRQGAGVDAANAGDVVFLEESVQGHVAGAVAGQVAVLADDERRRPDSARFKIGAVDAVVAHQRIGERDHLAGVRWVGENFLVAGHCGVEHHLAPTVPLRPEGLASEYRAVFQDQMYLTRH